LAFVRVVVFISIAASSVNATEGIEIIEGWRSTVTS
jgi:hypothetical protein